MGLRSLALLIVITSRLRGQQTTDPPTRTKGEGASLDGDFGSDPISASLRMARSATLKNAGSLSMPILS